MKLFSLIAVLVQSGESLSCFTCDELSSADCLANGVVEICEANEDSCVLEMRKRDGLVEQV